MKNRKGSKIIKRCIKLSLIRKRRGGRRRRENRFFENREENWLLERTIRSCFLKITRDTPLIFRRDAAFHELFSWIGREEDESRSGELDRESRDNLEEQR